MLDLARLGATVRPVASGRESRGAAAVELLVTLMVLNVLVLVLTS